MHAFLDVYIPKSELLPNTPPSEVYNLRIYKNSAILDAHDVVIMNREIIDFLLGSSRTSHADYNEALRYYNLPHESGGIVIDPGEIEDIFCTEMDTKEKLQKIISASSEWIRSIEEKRKSH